jgi:hypothetical protein
VSEIQRGGTWVALKNDNDVEMDREFRLVEVSSVSYKKPYTGRMLVQRGGTVGYDSACAFLTAEEMRFVAEELLRAADVIDRREDEDRERDEETT